MKTTMNQTQVFLAEEGNHYFQRNSAVYVNADPAHVPQSMQFYQDICKHLSLIIYSESRIKWIQSLRL